MQSIEKRHESQISPEKLESAFDGLIEEKGAWIAAGTGLNFVLPDGPDANPVDLPHYHLTRTVATRDQTPRTGETIYNWEEAQNDGRVTERVKTQIFFNYGRAFYERQSIITTNKRELEGEHSHGVLSGEEMQDIYDKVTNPNLVRSRDHKSDYHKNRYAQKSRAGQFVARVLRTNDAFHRARS